MSPSERYSDVLGRFGKPQGGEVVRPEDVEALRSVLPETYLDFLVEHGTGLWMDGYFQLRRPLDYRGVIAQVFDGDPDIRPEETYTVGLSAFGMMELWNTRHGIVRVDPTVGNVKCRALTKGLRSTDPDDQLAIQVSMVSVEALEAVDEDGNGLFKPLLKQHGPVPYGSIYAPRLHPALGGRRRADNYRIAPALPALSLIAQSLPFVLYDARASQEVRHIGAKEVSTP